MEYRDLIAFYGGLSKAARALRLRTQTVWRWRDRGIPLARQYQIEAYSQGLLLAPPIPASPERRVNQLLVRRIAERIEREEREHSNHELVRERKKRRRAVVGPLHAR